MSQKRSDGVKEVEEGDLVYRMSGMSGRKYLRQLTANTPAAVSSSLLLPGSAWVSEELQEECEHWLDLCVAGQDVD